jgi:hypothetical protein
MLNISNIILKNIFAKTIGEKFGIFLLEPLLIIAKINHNIGFWKNAKLFAENCQKSPKIAIITLTPGISVTVGIIDATVMLTEGTW